MRKWSIGNLELLEDVEMFLLVVGINPDKRFVCVLLGWDGSIEIDNMECIHEADAKLHIVWEAQ
jgi:hypothetical protein